LLFYGSHFFAPSDLHQRGGQKLVAFCLGEFTYKASVSCRRSLLIARVYSLVGQNLLEVWLALIFQSTLLGSLTTPSAVIVPGPKVMTWDDWVSQKSVVGRRTRRKEVAPEGQMRLGL
jgi:hypothetical protein